MPSPITEYEDKVAVVTGGASGVGRALARMLLDRGAHVVVADVEQAALDAAVSELQARAPKQQVLGVRTDVTDPQSVAALADRAFETFGRVNLLFNNAGVGAPSAKVWDTTPNDWLWVHSVNTFGVAYGIQAFVPRMLESGEPGFVANTTSGDGAIAPMPTASVYAASKAACAITTECLARATGGDRRQRRRGPRVPDRPGADLDRHVDRRPEPPEQVGTGAAPVPRSAPRSRR